MIADSHQLQTCKCMQKCDEAPVKQKGPVTDLDKVGVNVIQLECEGHGLKVKATDHVPGPTHQVAMALVGVEVDGGSVRDGQAGQHITWGLFLWGNQMWNDVPKLSDMNTECQYMYLLNPPH